MQWVFCTEISYTSALYLGYNKGMTELATGALSFRSYGEMGDLHAHDHIQIVLPVMGKLALEVDDCEGKLDLSQGAFIAPGKKHRQRAEGLNRFLVVDCARVASYSEAAERLMGQPFVAITPAVRHLIQFLAESTPTASVSAEMSQHSFPLLWDALCAGVETSRPYRLAPLLRHIQDTLSAPWSVASMARLSGFSESHLYVLFYNELGTSPQKWLTEARLRYAQELLKNTQISLAELALQCGYSDQTALTRAMKRHTQMTPAAYRRLHQ